MSGYTLLLSILIVSLLGSVSVPLWLKRKERTEKSTLRERIRPYVDQAYREELARQKSAEEEEESMRFLRGLAERLSSAALSEEIQQNIRNWLLRAGMRVRPAEFLIISFVIMTMTSCLSMLFAWSLIKSGELLAGFLGFFLGWLFPFGYVIYRRKQRMSKFNGQLLELITHMSNGLKSGLGFVQAMQTVAEDANPPASEEFQRVIRENNLGVPIETALERLVERMESEDLDLVVTAIMIQRQTGGNLSEILDNISSTIRERIKLKGMIRALTAQGKAGGFVITLLPIGLFIAIYFLRTDLVIQFLTHPIGIASIITGILMQALGIFFIWQIVNIEV